MDGSEDNGVGGWMEDEYMKVDVSVDVSVDLSVD